MTAIAADPKHLGARIGITSVLHTWGSALTHHPHAHMIVPGGGIAADGSRWISSRPDFLVHVKVLARLFRGKFLAMLIGAHSGGRLNLQYPCRARRQANLQEAPGAAAPKRVGRLLQRAVRRARAGAALSLALHPSRRHLEPPAHRR